MACITSNIQEMKNGRPQTVMFLNAGGAAKTYPNGTIVDLKDTMEAKQIGVGPDIYGRAYDHVHEVEQTKTATEVINKFIVVAPEINVEQYRLIDGQLSKFALQENETYSAYRLQKYDRIEYTFSANRFAGDVADFTPGKFLEIDAQGKLAVKLAGTAADSAFRVVSVVDTHLPFALAVNEQKDQSGKLLPTAGKKIKLEVVR
mgnify:FL=1